MAAWDNLKRSERVVTYGTLLAGAVIFAFPFLWLAGTSVKINREMTADRLRFLPEAPIPRYSTPYVDTREFRDSGCPDNVPASVWKVAQPRIEEAIHAALDAWRPRPLGVEGQYPAPDLVPEEYRGEMTEGLLTRIRARLRDTSRDRAVEFERDRRTRAGEDLSRARDSEIAGHLSTEAVWNGAAAIVEDARGLVSERLMEEILDQVCRRFCLGDVRVRTSDREFHRIYSGKEWEKGAEGEADLVSLVEKATPIQEARIRFHSSPRVLFRLAPRGSENSGKAASAAVLHDALAGDFPIRAIDRVYVGYRSDASWAAVTFEVIRDGRLWRSPETADLADRDWVEQELRWPGGEGDPMDQRLYMVLRDAGAAPAGDASFEVRVLVEKRSTSRAWMAKLTRNYRLSFKQIAFARYIATSFALSILSILLAIFSCTLVGYAFARLNWPGRDLCFGILLATMMIPAQVTMVPSFLIHRYLGWYNTLLPLWVPSAFGSAFFIFLLRQFFRNIPKDLEDAARMDGCGFLRIYWHVMLPLVKPTIATIAIFTFMGVWNNFMGPLIYVNDERLFPLALGMFKFQLRSSADVTLLMAGSFVMTLPIVILFFFVQRYFIQGISLTGIKG